MLFVLLLQRNLYQQAGKKKTMQTAHLDSASPAKTKCSNGYSGSQNLQLKDMLSIQQFGHMIYSTTDRLSDGTYILSA